MTRPSQRLAINASLIIAGVQYALDESPNDPAVRRMVVPTQPGDPGVEFERRLQNLALGWGQSKYVAPGGYDYAASGNLHRRLAWLPGSVVTVRTTGTTPIGEVSFCEYWDGTAANRRLLIITPRRVWEVDPAGTHTENDLGAGFTRANGMQWGVNYRAGGMSAPKVFISRNGNTATDYMVRRTAANTYAVGTANTKFAMALAKGKDSAGADVLWRVNENGKLNQAVADADPNVDASWSGASYPNSLYPLGDTSTRVNALTQQNRNMVAGKPDGAWTFDNVLNTIPITRGMEQTPDDDNFKWFKDYNGMAIAPTVQGIVWIDGLEWGMFGPVGTNPDARQLRGREVAVTGSAGNYVYCAVYAGGVSYIFCGTPKQQGETGSGPVTWHGPIGQIAKKVTDLTVSTVFGTRLWIGFVDTSTPPTTGGWATIELNADFSPVADLSTGAIYLPEGVLDMSGPGVIKDLRKAEFIAPADRPFSASNQWTIEIDANGSGSYTAIDGGTVSSGVTADRYWTTETSGKRPRGRLVYSGNAGAAELEAVVVRGTERPETTEEYQFRVRVAEQARSPIGVRIPAASVTTLAALRALMDAGRQTTVVFGEASFNARVTAVSEAAQRVGETAPVAWVSTITVRRVKTA